MIPDGSAAPDDRASRPRWRRIARLAAVASLAIAALLAPWWGRPALASLSFFRLRSIEIHGTRFIPPGDVLARLGVDTASSVWIDVGPLQARLAEHPQVLEAVVDRKLPATLVVRIRENLPVALVSTPNGFRALDSRGRELPVEPSAAEVDVPILVARDTALLRLLTDLRAELPALFDRVSDVRRLGRDELVLRVAALPVRAMIDVTVDRLADFAVVESDLGRRGIRVAEIDLRFRDQVIARLP